MPTLQIDQVDVIGPEWPKSKEVFMYAYNLQDWLAPEHAQARLYDQNEIALSVMTRALKHPKYKCSCSALQLLTRAMQTSDEASCWDLGSTSTFSCSYWTIIAAMFVLVSQT